MIKLKCINVSPLINGAGIESHGDGLKKGQTYTSPGLFIDGETNSLCYLINEISEDDYPYKLAERFRELRAYKESGNKKRANAIKK